MRRSVSSLVLAAAVAGALLGGCGKHEESAHRETVARSQRPVNPSSFPLYAHSTVITVVPVDSSAMFAALKASDPHSSVPKNFRGHEVIAETGATMHDLNVWLDTLKKAPPRGLRRVSSDGSGRSGIGSDRSTLSAISFESAGGGRSVYLVAADPRKVHDALGPALALIDNYQAVPGVLRGPIDDQAKKQLGYSVSEMLNEHSPAGAVMAALKRLQSANRRGILLIDETRAK
ncbi:MAG TPA: hypothetical protein VGD01_12675 [Candidatus Elarobacter sp.]|jgi:hypothetical protein